MSYTKLFQRNDTYGRCEFEYNIPQADNRSYMFTTLLDHENIALSASNMTTLFFLHYRDMQYCFGWRRHQQQKNSPHSSIDSFMFNNSTINLYFCWCALFCFCLQLRCIVGAAGAGLRRRCRYVTRLLLRTISMTRKARFCSGIFSVDCWVFYEMFFSFAICVLFSWWIISEMPLVRGHCKGCRYVTNFFAGLTLNSIGLVGFWMNILFSVWEFVLRVLVQFIFVFIVLFCLRIGHACPFPSVSKSEPLAPIWSRCSLQYFFYIF